VGVSQDSTANAHYQRAQALQQRGESRFILLGDETFQKLAVGNALRAASTQEFAKVPQDRTGIPVRHGRCSNQRLAVLLYVNRGTVAVTAFNFLKRALLSKFGSGADRAMA
jgi:hypothetical protein